MNLPPPQPNPYGQGPRLQELRPYPGAAPGQSSQFFPSGQGGFPPPQSHPPLMHTGPGDQPGQQIPSIGHVLPERHGYPPSSYGLESGNELRDYPAFHSHTLPGHADDASAESRGTRRRNNPVHVSVIGLPRYPSPAPRREERARFTPDDDRKLKLLKESFDLTWRQIEEFFPGRQSGTLQVRYCTKLKDRQEVNWTQNYDSRLKTYVREYDGNKWKSIAAKMGHNFTPQSCEERYRELSEVNEPPGPEAYE